MKHKINIVLKNISSTNDCLRHTKDSYYNFVMYKQH